MLFHFWKISLKNTTVSGWKRALINKIYFEINFLLENLTFFLYNRERQQLSIGKLSVFYEKKKALRGV